MPNIEPIYDFVFTDHALTEMARRNISKEDVRKVLAMPEQMEMIREGRAVYQSRIEMDKPLKIYILRVLWMLTTSRRMLSLFTEPARSKNVGDKP